MLEIRLRVKKEGDEDVVVKHFEDFDIIQAYWEKWLNDMHITDTKFFEHLGPGASKNILKDFIQPI